MNERLDTLSNFYSTDCSEDSRLLSKHGQVEYIISTTYIDKYLKPGDKILEVGAATGRYSINYAKKGYDVTAIELVQSNLDVLKSKITPDMKIRAEQGDAVDLSRFEDNTFDVTLILGPLYHLYEERDINKAIDEAIRVTKPKGKIYIAFLTNDSVVIDWVLKDHHFDTKGKSFSDTYEMAKELSEIFATFYVDEFDSIMKVKPVNKLHMVATDGMSHHMEDIVDELDDYEFKEWINYNLLSCERHDLQGYSNHMLYICEKE